MPMTVRAAAAPPSSFSISHPLLETDRALQGACDSPAADMHAPRSGLTTVARQGLSDPNESAQTAAGPTETVTGQGLGLGSETYIHAPLAFSSKVTVTIHPDLCDVDCSTNAQWEAHLPAPCKPTVSSRSGTRMRVTAPIVRSEQ